MMRRAGRAPATALACLALTAGVVACAPTAPPVEPPAAREVAFTCAGGDTIVAAFPVGGESVILEVQGERVELPRVPAVAGTEFSDGQTTAFFTTGGGASLERGGKIYAGCVSSELPSRPWVTFGAKNSGSTLRWPGHAGYRRTLWQWSDLRRAWR
jgi:membrane-bound inhibitor of C-type lysozyme